MTSPSETWDDDFEFQSNHSSRSSKTKKQKGASSSAVPPRPSEEESWDDAYEDEDMARRAVGQRRDTDEDMGSWGSGSEWSGDGDAEDLSHDSYTGVTSEPPERRSSSSASQAEHPNPRTPGLSHPHVPPLSNATLTPTSTPLTTSASFFSKISPVKKWRARDADLTPKASGTERTKPRMAGPEKKPRRLAQKPASTMTPNQDSEAHVYATGTHPKATSELKYGVSGANPPLITSLSGQSSQMETQPSTLPSLHHVPPLTPDLTFSPTSINSSILSPSLPPVSAGPGSTAKAALPSVSLPVSRSNRHVRPSTAIPSLSPAPSLPLLSSSAHNLPLSAPPTHTSTLILTPRRSSLSDLKRPQLKIPERISRVQQDIKRDMGDVKGFADCVAQLKDLQHGYAVLLRDLRTTLADSQGPTPSSISVSDSSNSPIPILIPRARRPSFSPKKRRDTLATPSPQSSPTKPTKRKFSLAATPQIPSRYATALDRLDAKYSVWWECAELLIELGGRTENGDAHVEGDTDRSDEDASLGLGLAAGMTRGRRPRAVTLGAAKLSSTPRPRSTSTGPPLASPMRPTQRCATTGRAGGKDLTPRQLALLRGMLETDARVGWDPRTAGVERMREQVEDNGSVREKGKGGGGRGIRDLWKGLKKGTSAVGSGKRNGSVSGELVSRGSSSCDSSTSETSPALGKLPRSFGSKTSRLPLSSKRTVTAADAAVLSRRKPPTRRPSLAGIFGLGQKAVRVDAEHDETGPDAVRDASSSDWDRMEVDEPEPSTVRATIGLRPKSSIIGSSIPSPSLRLRLRDPPSSPEKSSPAIPSSPQLIISFSNDQRNNNLSSPGSDTSRYKRFLRNAASPRPDNSPKPATDSSMSLVRLALTPESIRPLLGHAQNVRVHLNECIGEIRHIISGHSVI